MGTQEIIHSLFEGNVDRALALSMPYLEGIHALPPAEVMYIEPRMQTDVGHFSRLASAYSAVFSNVGLATTVLHRYGEASSGHDNWLGIFPVPDHVVGCGQISTRKHMRAFSSYFAGVFNECLSASGACFAVFATSRFLTMPGAVRAVEQAHDLRGAIFGVMETWPVPDCNDDDLVKSAFKSAAEQIERSTKSYLIFAESVPIRDFLIHCGFSAGRVSINPYPAAHRFPEPANRKVENRRPHFGSLAGTRELQNPGLVAAYLVESDTREVEWTVRLNLELASSQCNMKEPELRGALLEKGVNLIEDHMSDAEYDRALLSLDVMLLPYGDRYKTISSGIFLESLSAGVIPLVHTDSTMRKLYLELGGKAPPLKSLSTEDICRAVDLISKNLDDLLENRIDVWRSWLCHSQGYLAWSRRILALLGGAGMGKVCRSCELHDH